MNILEEVELQKEIDALNVSVASLQRQIDGLMKNQDALLLAMEEAKKVLNLLVKAHDNHN